MRGRWSSENVSWGIQVKNVGDGEIGSSEKQWSIAAMVRDRLIVILSVGMGWS